MSDREHVNEDGEFQSDKYSWCKPGFVPLKLTDPAARIVLLQYADLRESIDAAFSDDLRDCIDRADREAMTNSNPTDEHRRLAEKVLLGQGSLQFWASVDDEQACIGAIAEAIRAAEQREREACREIAVEELSYEVAARIRDRGEPKERDGET